MCNWLQKGIIMDTQDIGKIIKLLSEKMRTNADASLKKHGLTFSQMQVLCFLHKNNGKATQKEIEKYLEISHPAVVKLVARLEDAGFIVCSQDENDKRNKVVCTSKKAEKLRNELELEKNRADARFVAGLSEQEVKELRRLLNKLDQNCESNI